LFRVGSFTMSQWTWYVPLGMYQFNPVYQGISSDITGYPGITKLFTLLGIFVTTEPACIHFTCIFYSIL
jgi:hypothetical protein